MFDHIGISLFVGKSTPNLSNLTHTGNVWQGWQQYRIEGVCPLRVQYNPKLWELKISGSIPYLFRGHNYPAGTNDLREGIDYISQIVGMNVFAGKVDTFEYGQFVHTPHKTKVLLANHNHLPGFKAHGYINGASKYFESSALRVKLYDARQNFAHKIKGSPKEALQQDFGFKPDQSYLKVENHYKKPQIYFKQAVLVADLFSSQFVNLCKEDLLTTYQRIQKTPASAMPTNKKDLSASMLPLLVLKDLELQYGFNTEELLIEKLKTMPEEVLTTEDRKARKRQLRKMLSLLMPETSNSPFDVSEQLRQALYNTEGGSAGQIPTALLNRER
ncbi:hypothetical protein [Rudanella lutea]|uniref:hypothetical protein n=1 Tax=Rudanella lutea TaxID=451374 RepID=UPI00036550FC|nr:hypothetical protein [Rudanella lutea]